MKILTENDFLSALRARPKGEYYALYSSVLGGIVTEPGFMVIPIDDHLVHRGDGVFDTGKCVNGGLYNFPAHLRRLERSALALGIKWPGGNDEIMELTRETIRAAGKRDCAVRVILARGPGSLAANPYDCPTPALYIIVYKLGIPFMEKHPEGAVVRGSSIDAKPPELATIKACNYIPNVMMKKECVDCGADFTVGFDANKHMTEGSTENFGIVTEEGTLVFPALDNILEGTTMLRVLSLAQDAEIEVEQRDITEEEIYAAREMVAVGTTINVVAVKSYNDHIFEKGGAKGKTFQLLAALIKDDIKNNSRLREELF